MSKFTNLFKKKINSGMSYLFWVGHKMQGFYTRETFTFYHFQFCLGRKSWINKSRILHRCVWRISCYQDLIQNSFQWQISLTRNAKLVSLRSFQFIWDFHVWIDPLFLRSNEADSSGLSLGNSYHFIPVIKHQRSIGSMGPVWCTTSGQLLPFKNMTGLNLTQWWRDLFMCNISI